MSNGSPAFDALATRRAPDGHVIEYLSAETVCRNPRRGGRLHAVGADGRRAVLRCRKCDGCRALEQRRTVQRLLTRYDAPAALWRATVYLPARAQARAARLLNRHREKLAIESHGLYRSTLKSFSLLVREPQPIREFANRHGWPMAEVVRLNTSSGRSRFKAFRELTKGLRRDDWPAWSNRFYDRGLPPAERDNWSVEKVSGPVQRSERAVAADGSSTHAPERWFTARKPVSQTAEPIPAALLGFVQGIGGRPLTDASVRPVLTREAVLAQEAARAALREINRRAAGATFDSSMPLSFERGAYATSLPVADRGPPPEPIEAVRERLRMRDPNSEASLYARFMDRARKASAEKKAS